MIHGSVFMERSMRPVKPTSRRRCSCGCEKRATHVGLGVGMALMRGCELYVRRWIRDGERTRNARQNAALSGREEGK